MGRKGRESCILVVEDDEAINHATCSYLEKAGHGCVAAFSGTEATLLLDGGQRFDLVVTDLMLPGASGEDVVRHVRATDRTPVIVISAKSALADRVGLLRDGADDYLVKPFDLEELLARVEVQLRRAAAASGAPSSPEARHLVFRDWLLDEDAHRFTVAGVALDLTPTEFTIVRTLMAAPKRVHTKRNLSVAIGGDSIALDDKAIATHIGNIRAKLRPTSTDGYLETVWGIGFKLAE